MSSKEPFLCPLGRPEEYERAVTLIEVIDLPKTRSANRTITILPDGRAFLNDVSGLQAARSLDGGAREMALQVAANWAGDDKAIELNANGYTFQDSLKRSAELMKKHRI